MVSWYKPRNVGVQKREAFAAWATLKPDLKGRVRLQQLEEELKRNSIGSRRNGVSASRECDSGGFENVTSSHLADILFKFSQPFRLEVTLHR